MTFDAELIRLSKTSQREYLGFVVWASYSKCLVVTYIVSHWNYRNIEKGMLHMLLWNCFGDNSETAIRRCCICISGSCTNGIPYCNNNSWVQIGISYERWVPCLVRFVPIYIVVEASSVIWLISGLKASSISKWRSLTYIKSDASAADEQLRQQTLQ